MDTGHKHGADGGRKCCLCPPDLVALAVHRTGLGAQRGRASCPPPALLAEALEGGGVAPAVSAAGSRAQGEGVGGIEAQEVVVGITEEVKQHLDRKNGNNAHLWNSTFLKGFRPLYLPRLGFNGLRHRLPTQAGEEGALVRVSVINKQVIVGALRLHEGEVQDNAVAVAGS